MGEDEKEEQETLTRFLELRSFFGRFRWRIQDEDDGEPLRAMIPAVATEAINNDEEKEVEEEKRRIESKGKKWIGDEI